MIDTIICECRVKFAEIIKKIKFEHYCVFAILLASFLIKLIYVFKFTDYQSYLVSDMEGYWQRAEVRFKGHIVDKGQVAIWAPFYHYILTEIFKYISFFGLMKYKLEAVLVLNILLSTLSLAFVYLIAFKVSRSQKASFAALILYAFNFVFMYTNAFILTEHLAIPLFLLAVYLLLEHHDDKFVMLLAGVIFALAVGIRPALGPLGVSFALYIFFAGGKSIKSILRATLFSVGFVLIIFSVLVENYHVSEGQMKSLSAHGGANFYFAQCRTKKIHTQYDGYSWVLVPPILNEGDFARQEKFTATRPFYDQKYFYDIGWDCLKYHPENWYENIKMLRALFWGPLFPSFGSVKWIKPGKQINNYLMFFMFISLGLLYYPLRDKKLDLKKVAFLLSIPLWIAVIAYFYASGQRQILPAYFAIHALFFALIVHIRSYEFKAIRYFLILLVVFLLFQAL